MNRPLTLLIVLLLAPQAALQAAEIIVRDAESLRSALRGLEHGVTVKISPGEYPGGHSISGIDRLTIEALDPQQPPVFKGGTTGFQFSRCAELTLRHLRISGQSVNGLNLDDGGDLAHPVTGITLDHIEVSDIGPTGNHDAIKCSGLDKATIRDCTISGWGGQGIDFVCCHRALITGCRLLGKEGFSASAGIQLKGGTSDVIVEKCHFTKAGERPISLGGSTGMPYFRPQGVKYEAARVIVRNNTIEGSLCAAAFVGVDGAEFVGNTVRYPGKWIFRILQETQEPGFAPCRNVLIKDNRITFRRSQVQTDINIGGGTAPETFRFENNHWLAEDQPQASKPKLPVAEKGGVYGRVSEPKSKSDVPVTHVDLLPTLASDSGPAANLLQNPSFEEKAGDGVAGWTSRAWAGKEATRWFAESPGRTGERCVSIASDRGGDAAWTALASVQPGAWYRLSGWIKTKDVRGAVGALLNIQNMQEVKTPAVAGTRDWTRVATVFRAEVARLEINCLFGGWGSSTGQAWYDDVALEHVAEPPDETRAVVTIDTGAPSVPYSPMIFGGFLEHFNNQVYGGVFEPGSPLSDEKGFRRDVLAALKELQVPIVRWPGGCYVSGYHWEAGVGKQRKRTDDMAWGVMEPNTFGTDEYVELCRTLGWTPYICNNAGNGTVEEMRNWVEYCNGNSGKFAQMRRDNGYAERRNVPIWSIGNENWGQHEIGYKPIEQWAPLVLEAAKAMKKADPTVQLTAAALPNREWTLPLLKAAGEYLDYISIHSYWLPLWERNDMPDYLTCIMHSESPEKMIRDFIGVLEEAGCRGRIKIAFDEWNLRGWHHPGFPRKTVQNYTDPEVKRLVAARAENDIASQYTMADALFSASFFNACLRHAEDVGMANIAPLVNTRGPLYVHPKGIVKRTHFHAMAMYANELEPRVGKLDLEAGTLRHGNRSIPVLDAIATVDEKGQQWAIALVNRHPAKPVACTVRMKERLLDGEYAAVVLAGDSPDSFNDIENPNRVTPRKTTLTVTKGAVNLPPHSLTIIKVLK